MTDKHVSLGLGGTNVLALPKFARLSYLKFARALGVRWFDTAIYYGDSMSLLSKVRFDDSTVVTKVGLSPEYGPDALPDVRWEKGFPADKVASLGLSAVHSLSNFDNVHLLLHLPIEKNVKDQIQALADLRLSNAVAGVGFSCDHREHVLTNLDWCDTVVSHYSLIENFSDFSGRIAIHGVFRDGLSMRQLRMMASCLKDASQVIFLTGTSNPVRLTLAAVRLKLIGAHP